MLDVSVDVDDLMEQLKSDSQNNTSMVLKENATDDLTIVKFGNKEISIDDEDALMAAALQSTIEDKTQSDKLYNYYVTRIEVDKDRSDSVREGLAKAVELRQNSTANIIKLIDMKKKYSAKAAQGNSLVSLNLSPRETGININKLTDEILNG